MVCNSSILPDGTEVPTDDSGDGYKYHVFTGPGNLDITAASGTVSVEYVVVVVEAVVEQTEAISLDLAWEVGGYREGSFTSSIETIPVTVGAGGGGASPATQVDLEVAYQDLSVLLVQSLPQVEEVRITRKPRTK